MILNDKHQPTNFLTKNIKLHHFTYHFSFICYLGSIRCSSCLRPMCMVFFHVNVYVLRFSSQERTGTGPESHNDVVLLIWGSWDLRMRWSFAYKLVRYVRMLDLDRSNELDRWTDDLQTRTREWARIVSWTRLSWFAFLFIVEFWPI